MSRALAVARTWGVPRTVLVAAALGGFAQLVAASYVGLPSFAADIPALQLVPPAAALVLASPLLDQTPDLTLGAGRPLTQVLLLRYVTTQVAGGLVVASLALTGWTLERSLVVVVFLAGSASAVALTGSFYWVPVLAASYLWLLRGQHLDDAGGGEVTVVVAVVGLVLGASIYVAAGLYRVHRSRRPRR